MARITLTVQASVAITLTPEVKSTACVQVWFDPDLQEASRQSGISVEKLQESLRDPIPKAVTKATHVRSRDLILTNVGVRSAIVIAARSAAFVLPK
jgi:hypothetical protein